MTQAQDEIYRNGNAKHTRIHLPYELKERRDVNNDGKFETDFSPKFKVDIISKSKRKSWNKMG